MSQFDTFPAATFDQFVTNFLSVLQTSTPAITDASEGSVSLALAEATGGNDIALQALIYHVYNIARLTTSTGVDVDSFVGDFGLTRAPSASASTNTVVLTRSITSSTLAVPAGAVVQTLVGSIQFNVIGDTGQPDWDPGSETYIFPIGAATMTITVVAVVPGAAGNVLANTITQLVSGITGVNSVTNTQPTAGGADQESDDALKLRFQEYIESLGKATLQAIEAAIAGVQAGLTFSVNESVHFDGSPFLAGFTVVVDDGSGNIPSPTLTAVHNAVDAVRAAGISFEVHAPTDIAIGVTVTVTAAAGFSDPQVSTAVTAAIDTYILSLGVAVSVNYVTMANVIQNAQINGVNCVFAQTNLLVNGSNVNIGITDTQLARPGTIVITPGS
jgi:uncharacterized phage protein gp47/JayE